MSQHSMVSFRVEQLYKDAAIGFPGVGISFLRTDANALQVWKLGRIGLAD